MTCVCRVERHSPADRAGVRVGETLTHINEKPIVDVLDYKFYAYDTRLTLTLQDSDVHDIALQVDMQMILEKAKAGASETVRKGIDAIVLFSQGYSCREIGELMGAEANLVSAWISKARKYLKEMPEMKSYICGG